MEKKDKKQKQVAKKEEKVSCADKQCWKHGGLKARGREFEGYIVKKLPRRIVIEFERTMFIKKYERYMKKKTKLHARLPDCMKDEADVGDYVLIKECRPLSKIIHFILIKILRKKQQ